MDANEGIRDIARANQSGENDPEAFELTEQSHRPSGTIHIVFDAIMDRCSCRRLKVWL
jgi:hypothetical protein